MNDRWIEFTPIGSDAPVRIVVGAAGDTGASTSLSIAASYTAIPNYVGVDSLGIPVARDNFGNCPFPRPAEDENDSINRLIVLSLRDSEKPPKSDEGGILMTPAESAAIEKLIAPKPSGPPPMPAIAGLTQNTFDGERLGRLSWMPGAKE
jgi:hypothetical protein